MHVFEFALKSEPAEVIMSRVAFHDLLVSFVTSSPAMPVAHASAMRADWERRSLHTTVVSAENLQRGSEYVAQAMLAERGPSAHFTYRELMGFCHHLTEALSSLPRLRESYTRTEKALAEFAAAQPEDWSDDVWSPVGLDAVRQSWATAFKETSAPTSGFLTGAQLLAVVDTFIATLYTRG